jgi:radical SAM superfamily enzyme YgiQ (UPF0313 family)
MAIDTLPKAAVGLDLRVEFRGFIAERALTRPKELVLIQPALVPQKFFDVNTARSGGYYNFPPAGLLYLAAAARAADPSLKIDIIDINHELLKAAHGEGFEYGFWCQLLRERMQHCENPHIVITYMFGTTKPCFIEIAEFIRKEFPDAPVLSGGVQATFDHEEILRDNLCDIVGRREGEGQIYNYLRSLAGEEDAVPLGMSFLRGGKVIDLGRPPEDNAVQWDIREFYDLIKIEEYHRYGGLGAFSRYVGPDATYATVIATRGCRARCTFCTVRNFNGFGLRQRSVQDVIDEIKYLVEKKGVRYIDWLDDDLLWDPERTVALFKGIAEQVPGLEWTASNGVIGVAVNDEIMKWMVASGMRAFKIGVESGNDRMLKTIKKPTTKPKLRDRVKLFAKYPQVLFSTNFIIGFPNESFGEMMDSYNFARELHSDWASFYICQPLKGTEMFSAFQALGDDRTREERYDKSINPGRSAERGEFGYLFTHDRSVIRTGWDVFNIPYSSQPNLEQQKEIWFAFNLVANFLDNPNFQPGGNVAKLKQWIAGIYDGYPYDASMAAALAHCSFLLSDRPGLQFYRDKFLRLTGQSSYWQSRSRQFPELLLLAHIERAPEWFTGDMPTSLVREISCNEIQVVA